MVLRRVDSRIASHASQLRTVERGNARPQASIAPWEYWAASTIAVSARILFWAITRREFEDALITIAHAQNGASGLGLVHHVGELEPVHGFTSALSVLIPLVGEIAHAGIGLTTMRVVSVLAGALTVVIALGLCRELGVTRGPRWLIVLYVALNSNHIFYGMAGMETQVAVMLLLASILTVVHRRPAWQIGTLLGMTILARPDFILWAGFVLLFATFESRSEAAKVSVWATAVLAPWLAFTVYYYGSPIPNTITAKSQVWGALSVLLEPDGIRKFIGEMTGAIERLQYTFAPFFDNSLVIRAPIPRFAAIVVSLVVMTFAFRGAIELSKNRRWWPVIAFAGTYTIYRIAALPDYYFDWYLPPYTAVVVLLAGKGLDVVDFSPAVRRGAAVAISTLLILPFAWTLGLEQKVEVEIDRGVRRPLAWFLDEGAEQESVVAESAGFIGYYSDVLLWDFPGLTSDTSRTALAAMENPTMQALIEELRPQWIVLRPFELEQLEASHGGTASEYRLVREFGGNPTGVVRFGGLELATIDERFGVYELSG